MADVRIDATWSRRVNRGGSFTYTSDSSNSQWYTTSKAGTPISATYLGGSPRTLFNDTSGSWNETSTWTYYTSSSFTNSIRSESYNVNFGWSRTVQDWWSSGSTTLTAYTATYPGTNNLVPYYEVSTTLTANTTYSDWSNTTNWYTFPTTQDYWGKVNEGQDNGYSVTGWKTTNSAYSANTYTPGQRASSVRSGTFNWYPVLQANTYQITLDLDYTGAPAPTKIAVVYKSNCTNLTTPTRPGYSFDGWYENKEHTGTKYTTSTVYTTIGNKTLYAKWNKASYILTANANNGSIPTTTGWTGSGATATKSVTYEDAYGDLPIPTRVNYQFVGWFTSATGGTQVTSTTKMGTRATIIYAHWEEGFKVIFDLQGGTKDGDPFPEAYDDGHVIKIYRILKPNSTANNEMQPPVRDGYLFEGYYTAPNMGGTKVYQWVSTTLVKGIANTRGYWDSKIQWINSVNNLVLYAGWRKVNSYAHDGSTWRPIRKMYGYNNGWKLIKSFSAYDGSEWKDGVS